MTSEAAVLYTFGEYDVILTEREGQPVYGIRHAATRVVATYTTVLGGAIRGAYMLNKDVQEARSSPESLHEEMQGRGISGGAGLQGTLGY